MHEMIEVLGTFIRETSNPGHMAYHIFNPVGKDKGLNPDKTQCIQSIASQSESWLCRFPISPSSES